MQIYISNKEIEQLAEGLVEVVYGKPPPKQVDMNRIAAYLKLMVVYECFAEEDKDKIGFVSDGKAPLTVYRNGKKTAVVFPKETIVLDDFLLDPIETTRQRFVLAHEIGHVVLNRADPMHMVPCFNRVYNTEREYELAELRERMNLEECQANSMGASMMMTKTMLYDAIRRHIHRKSIPMYGDSVFLPNMKPTLQRMADELGVSYTALIIQLKKYKLLELHSMTEYFAKTGAEGDEGNDGATYW